MGSVAERFRHRIVAPGMKVHTWVRVPPLPLNCRNGTEADSTAFVTRLRKDTSVRIRLPAPWNKLKIKQRKLDCSNITNNCSKNLINTKF